MFANGDTAGIPFTVRRGVVKKFSVVSEEQACCSR